MTMPTGNVWMDPDSGKPANPGNRQTDLGGGLPMEQKYGKDVLGEPSPSSDQTTVPSDVGQPVGEAGQEIPEAARVTQELVDDDRAGAELPEVESQLGRAVTEELEANAAETSALESTKLTIRAAAKMTHDKDKAVAKAATATLAEIAKTEYARPDGGREPIKKILSRHGHGKPKT